MRSHVSVGGDDAAARSPAVLPATCAVFSVQMHSAPGLTPTPTVCTPARRRRRRRRRLLLLRDAVRGAAARVITGSNKVGWTT